MAAGKVGGCTKREELAWLQVHVLLPLRPTANIILHNIYIMTPQHRRSHHASSQATQPQSIYLMNLCTPAQKIEQEAQPGDKLVAHQRHCCVQGVGEAGVA